MSESRSGMSDSPVRRPHPERIEAHEIRMDSVRVVDADGNLYVSEWLIGGRYTKLRMANTG